MEHTNVDEIKEGVGMKMPEKKDSERLTSVQQGTTFHKQASKVPSLIVCLVGI